MPKQAKGHHGNRSDPATSLPPSAGMGAGLAEPHRRSSDVVLEVLLLRPRGANWDGKGWSSGEAADHVGQRHARAARAAVRLAWYRPDDRKPESQGRRSTEPG